MVLCFLPLFVAPAVVDGASVNPLNSFTAANIDFKLQGQMAILTCYASSNIDSLPAEFAITIQKPNRQVYAMSSMSVVLTPEITKFTSQTSIPLDVPGTWTMTIMMFRDDGITALGVVEQNFTI